MRAFLDYDSTFIFVIRFANGIVNVRSILYFYQIQINIIFFFYFQIKYNFTFIFIFFCYIYDQWREPLSL